MSGHTPGPWLVAKPDKDELVIVAASGTDDAEDIAVMDARLWLHPSAIANAHIITAAPDLLSALGHLAGLFEALHPNAEAWGDYKAARAAIKSARGVL